MRGFSNYLESRREYVNLVLPLNSNIHWKVAELTVFPEIRSQKRMTEARICSQVGKCSQVVSTKEGFEGSVRHYSALVIYFNSISRRGGSNGKLLSLR
jgi:hypothetical protein